MPCTLSVEISGPAEKAARARWQEFVLEVGGLFVRFQGDYGAIYPDGGASFGIACLHEGLNDVHWVNYFGPAVLDTVGRDRIEGWPFEQRAWLDGERFVGQLVAAPPAHSARPPSHLVDAAKSAIGEAYFQKNRAPARIPIQTPVDGLLVD